MAEALLGEKGAFEGALRSVAVGEGVVARPRDAIEIVSVIAHAAADVRRRMRDLFGVDIPSASGATVGSKVVVVAIGPRAWWVVADADAAPGAETPGAETWMTKLRRALGDCAAVTDQSSGYAVLRVSGPKARAMFEKGLAVDLHPRAFRIGSAASTTCAHIGVTLWQVDDTPTYDVAIFRSYAGDFAHWLMESAAEFGLRANQA